MPSQPESQSRSALPVGTVLNEAYAIEAEIGHGGLGIVYKARHREIGRLVAVKEYLPIDLAIRESSTVHPRHFSCDEHFAEGMNRFLDEAKQLVAHSSPKRIGSG